MHFYLEYLTFENGKGIEKNPAISKNQRSFSLLRRAYNGFYPYPEIYLVHILPFYFYEIRLILSQ
jgi:hypothetical protein